MELNFANNLFLGVEELNHFKKSLGSEGYIKMFKQSVSNYGVVKKTSDTNFTSLKVVNGTANGLISINAGTAVDSNVNIIDIPTNLVDNITIAGDSVTRYIFVEYTSTDEQEGTVSISANGQLTGVGTKFTEILRGMPNFPSRIKFNGSANTLEYDVASVTNDTTAQLNVTSGSLTVEAGKKFTIVGTFTPGITVPGGSKFPGKRDFYTLTTSLTNTPTAGTQFVLCSVVNNGTTTTITDLRETNLFTLGSNTTDDGNAPISATNKVVGALAVKYPNPNSPKDKNIMTLEWSFNSSTGNWSYDAPNKKVIITAGGGGSMINIAAFTTGDFDGWYVHEVTEGNKYKISTSTKVGATIELVLAEYTATMTTSNEIKICPAADFIELFTGTVPVNLFEDRSHIFPISDGKGDIEVVAGPVYKIRWRHIRGNRASKEFNINNGNYYPESAHDATTGAITGSSVAYPIGAGIPTVLNSLNHEADKASKSTVNVFTASNTFNAQAIFNGELMLNAYREDSAVSGNIYHNLAAFYSNKPCLIIKQTVTGGNTMTGFTSTTPYDGKIFVVKLDSASHASGTLTLTHQDAGSAVASRMFLKNKVAVKLFAGDSITFRYDGTNTTWVEITRSIGQPWIDHSTIATPTLNGTNTVAYTQFLKRYRYKYLDDNTILVQFRYHYQKTGGGAADVQSFILTIPPIPSGLTAQTNITSQIVQAKNAPSHTGQVARPVMVEMDGVNFTFYSAIDGGNWIEQPGTNRIDFEYSGIIHLI
jgi:hypothetical protein